MVNLSNAPKSGAVAAQVIVEKEFKSEAAAKAWAAKVTAEVAAQKPDATESHFWS